MSLDTAVSPPGTPPDRDAIAGLLAQISADYRRRLDEGGIEPPSLGVQLVRAHRLGAARLDRELGGWGLSTEEFFDLVIALAEADPDLTHILRVHFSVVEELQRVPRRPHTDRWVAVVAEGGLIGGVTSEQSTNQVGGQKYDTRLVRTDAGLVLRGRKYYSTGAQYSDYLRVSAQGDEGAPVTAIIPADRSGVVHTDDWDGIGQRHTGSGTTLLNDVTVHDDELFALGTKVGVDRARGALVQLYLHAIAAGILRSLVTDAVALVRGRQRTYTFATNSSPTADPQLLQVVGELDAAAYAASAVVRSAARELGHALQEARIRGIDPALEHQASVAAARVKVAIEEPALRAAGRIFDVGGASAIRASAHLDRHWRNLRTLFAHNPTVYKARVLGDIAVNDAPLPDSSFF
jgi:alkylation response protein AidB-like acyl-CoA dehydrogenase